MKRLASTAKLSGAATKDPRPSDFSLLPKKKTAVEKIGTQFPFYVTLSSAQAA
jgi:hypothetical protein